MRSVSILLCFLASIGVASAGPREFYQGQSYNDAASFLGTWHNVDVRRTQVVRIVITPYEGDRVIVHIFGLCHGEPCSFGSAEGALYRSRFAREREQDNAAILVKIHKEFVHGDVLVRFDGHGGIVSHALLAFDDGRGRVYSVERFEPARGLPYREGDDRLSYNRGDPRYGQR